jgi:hypothetical protein
LSVSCRDSRRMGHFQRADVDFPRKVSMWVPAGQERGNLTNAAGRRCGPEVAAPGALLLLSTELWRNVIAVSRFSLDGARDAGFSQKSAHSLLHTLEGELRLTCPGERTPPLGIQLLIQYLITFGNMLRGDIVVVHDAPLVDGSRVHGAAGRRDKQGRSAWIKNTSGRNLLGSVCSCWPPSLRLSTSC